MRFVSSLRPSKRVSHLIVAAIMALVAVPVAFLVFAAIQTVTGRNESGSFLDLLLDLSVIYVAVAAVGIVGAIAYSLVIQLLSTWRPVPRWQAVVLTPIAALPWAILPMRALVFSWPLVAGIAVGLAVMASMIPLPSDPDAP
jgi:hypothetical protein